MVVEKVDESDASTSHDHGGKENKSKTEGSQGNNAQGRLNGEEEEACVPHGQTESDAQTNREKHTEDCIEPDLDEKIINGKQHGRHQEDYR